MDFILTSHNTLSIVFTVQHIPNSRPRHFSCQLQVIPTSKPLNPPSVPSDNRICLWSAWWTSTGLKRTQSVSSRAVSVCGGWWNRTIVQRRLGPGWVSSQSHQKLLPRKPPPLDPLFITCEGGLVIFLIILHFISILPFKTKHENWLPQRSIFIISLRPINYPTLGPGWTSCADSSRSLSQQSHIIAGR